MAWQLVWSNQTGEGGERYWQDDATGATARFDAENPVPPPAVNLGSSGLVSVAPSFTPGAEGESVRDFDVAVGGRSAADYGSTLMANSQRVGDTGTILNPSTGQREQAYGIDVGGKRAWLPKSLALQVDPNAQPYTVYPDGGYDGIGGFIDRYGTQALMAAVLSAGAWAPGMTGSTFGSAGVPDALSEFGAGSFGAGGTTGMELNSLPSWLTDSGASSWSPLDAVGGSYTDSGVMDLSTLLNSSGGATPINWAAEAGLSGSSLSSIMTKVAEQVGPTAAKSLLQKLTSGEMNTSDFLGLLGKIAPAALGAFASSQSGNDYRDLAEKYMGFGAPSRARYEASFQPGFTMESDPGYKDALDQTTKSFLHKASVSGNPVDSPNAWKQTLSDVNASFAYPALQNYRAVNANTGGLASFTPAAISAESAATGSNKGVYDAIGYGMADIFAPRKKGLAELLQEYA